MNAWTMTANQYLQERLADLDEQLGRGNISEAEHERQRKVAYRIAGKEGDVAEWPNASASKAETGNTVASSILAVSAR